MTTAEPEHAPGRRRPGRWIAAGVAVVVVAVVAVFVLAQGGGSGGGPLDAIAKAAEVTQREPGGRAVISAKVTSLTTPEGITENGTMTFDDSGRARGELTVTVPNGKEVKVVSISDGRTAYASSDALDQALPDGKKWMEVDLGAATKGVDSSDPAAGGPTEGLKILERVHGSEEVGKEDVGGVPTTHYRGTLATSDEVFGVKVNVSAPQIDVWIDAQDRVRRMRVVVTGSVGEVSTKTQVSMDFVEFGRVPQIELPPADEVFDATSEIESNVQSAAEGG